MRTEETTRIDTSQGVVMLPTAIWVRWTPTQGNSSQETSQSLLNAISELESVRQQLEAQYATGIENNIEGWMSFGELAWLREMAKVMGNIVEIGSWKGRSTKTLLDFCPGTVYSVDLFKGTLERPDGLNWKDAPTDILPEFLANVGHYPNLTVYREDSIKAAEQMGALGPFDMVFIDGGHTYEQCLGDIKAWLPFTRKLLCGHDYAGGWPGVVQAVDEQFGLRAENPVGSIWAVDLTLERDREQNQT